LKFRIDITSFEFQCILGGDKQDYGNNIN